MPCMSAKYGLEKAQHAVAASRPGICMMLITFLFPPSPDALKLNLAKEMERNSERFRFLKWGSKSLKNFLIVPPGSGIVHQVSACNAIMRGRCMPCHAI